MAVTLMLDVTYIYILHSSDATHHSRGPRMGVGGDFCTSGARACCRRSGRCQESCRRRSGV